MDPEPRLTPALKVMLERFRRETGVKLVIVFGSTVRGEAGEGSDVDLLVVDERFEGRKFFERPIGLRGHLPSDIPVDLLCYTPAEVDELKERPTLVREAFLHGVRLAG